MSNDSTQGPPATVNEARRNAPTQARGGTRASQALLARRADSERVWASLRNTPPRPRSALAIVIMIVAVAFWAALAGKWRPTPAGASCEAAAAPRSNWDFCVKPGLFAEGASLIRISARNTRLTAARLAGANLTRADLSYAELTGADLALADLTAARLFGATLRNANLAHTRLTQADLRFADLTDARVSGADWRGARLDHAIWTDGRRCAAPSLGRCIRARE